MARPVQVSPKNLKVSHRIHCYKLLFIGPFFSLAIFFVRICDDDRTNNFLFFFLSPLPERTTG